jgi:4-carboxymuconolactone decarboxylase
MSDEAIYGFPVSNADRIGFPEPDEMNAEQRAVYDDVVSGPRGRMVGPLRAVIHSPELADKWQKIGEFVRYRTVLPEELKELAIITCGRRWNSDVEWAVHSQVAARAGISLQAIKAIEAGSEVVLERVEEREIYEFTRLILKHGQVSDAAYSAVRTRWGDRGVVELTAIIGYYSMVAMMVNVHLIPVPEGEGPGIRRLGPLLTELAPSKS